MDDEFRFAGVPGFRGVDDGPACDRGCGRPAERDGRRGGGRSGRYRSARSVAAMVCCACMLVLSGRAHAQSGGGVAQDAVVRVEIDTAAITLRNVRGLDFGVFLPYGRTGTIVLSANGSVQANNVHLLDPAATHPSSWTIEGTPGAPYTIAIPTIANVTANGMSMSISPLVRNGPASLALDAAGQGRVEIGGTLNIPPYIVPGLYSGTFAVTVNYN